MTDEQLKKLFHNLKNDLTSMTALLNLHKVYKDSLDTEELLNRLYERQTVIATAYEKLYQEGNYPYVSLIGFINEMISKVHRTLSEHCSGVGIRKDVEDIKLPVKTTIALGQILIELLTNSCRHAFVNTKENNKSIEFHIATDGKSLILKFSDNGCGLPKDFKPESSRTLGMQFIKSLSRQLGGKPEFGPNPNGQGMHCRIELKI